jgi:hypothetical protein
MANISHSVLTGSQLHEPKGADTAVNGTVYVANGAGSGTWQSVGTSAFTGMISDFVAPVAPAGWLELDGTTISTSTYSALYSVMTIQTSGTRLNGNATITSIPDTSTFKVGYYVFGTGLTSGTTILSVDSGTQITLSGNATSSGSGTFAISPWLLNTGTIKLPDVATAGRYRRSRTSTTAVGQIQASQNLAHSHTGALTTGNNSVDHTHTFSGVSGTNNTSLDHTHNAHSGNSTRNDGTSVASGSPSRLRQLLASTTPLWHIRITSLVLLPQLALPTPTLLPFLRMVEQKHDLNTYCSNLR